MLNWCEIHTAAVCFRVIAIKVERINVPVILFN